MTKKFLIIGSGFNALATAFFLLKENTNIKIIYEKNFKGVLGSVQIEDEKYDLGYQFFDGLDKESEKFITQMFPDNDLYDFKYGASTYSNNLFYEDHAIPYWPSYGKLFVSKAFFFYLKKFLKYQIFKNYKKLENLEDLFNQLPNNIRRILIKACEKHYQIKPNNLDVIANEMSTFTNFRQTLFNDKVSNIFKKNSTFFDEHLASRRKSISDLDNISLYPKGKNMEFIADKLIQKLKDQGVIFEQYNFENINLIPHKEFIEFNNQRFDRAILTTSLSNIHKIFKISSEKSFEHYVPQIFIYFTVKNLSFKFQYTQINDLKLYCSRISNCSLYSKKTKKNNHLLIAELPLSPKNKLWEEDEELKKIAWKEIQKCGIVSNNINYENVKILKVPRTFPIPKTNYFKILNQTNLDIKTKFFNNVKMIGQGIFTRHKFVKELLNKVG